MKTVTIMVRARGLEPLLRGGSGLENRRVYRFATPGHGTDSPPIRWPLASAFALRNRVNHVDNKGWQSRKTIAINPSVSSKLRAKQDAARMRPCSMLT